MVHCIKNGLVVDGNAVTARDVWLENGRFIPPQEHADRVTDARGGYILPGFVDIHTHGVAGVYYGDPMDFAPALAHCASKGITTLLPTLGAWTPEKLTVAMEHILSQQAAKHPGTAIGGIHLEGPFISHIKKGAMNPPELSCTKEAFEKLIAAGRGQVRIMTIAPERENACQVIRRGAELGIRMSIGHTNATYEEACAGIAAGATGATHTFNAMRSYGHRDPGVLGAVLTDPGVTCEAICDMVHLAPATVRLIHRCKGTEKMILVSDSGMFAGLGDGAYTYGGKTRHVSGGVSRSENGTISSSCCTVYEDAQKLLELGFSLSDIVAMGAENPAKAVGLYDSIGSVTPGKDADFFICDQNLRISSVYVKGERYV